MADFLGALAGQISSQFSLGENTNHTLDSIDMDTGKNVKYGSLGDFAQHFDQSSERRYVEEGYLRIDPFTSQPKQFEILMQEPNATVLVKKRMFSSVGDNFRPDFMNDDEKIYYKAMRVLFQNKCAQISALEKLSKIQKITESMDHVADQIMPIIFTLTDTLNSGLDAGSNLFGAFGGADSPLQKEASQFTNTIDTLRRVYGFNQSSKVTSWITDSTNLFQSQFGQGTGVIEITNFTSLNTSTSTDLNGGNFSLSITDPYEAMLITEYDIEKAISDATNMFYNRKIFQFARESAATLINDLTVRLNKMRADRNASPISIKIDPDTLLGKRVTAILDRIGIELPFDYDSTSVASIFSGGAFGGGATVPPEYLKGGEIAGNDGLDPNKKKFGNIRTSSSQTKTTHTGMDSEVSLFSRLVGTIYSTLSQEANSQGSFQLHNEKTNYTRRKLRFNFLGKLIIQPMDIVHIYLSSKSRFDTKLLSGLKDMFTGLGVLQTISNTLTSTKNAFETLFNPQANVPLQIEKSAFVGSEFPNRLWSLIRGQFVSEKEGTHVFAGIVESAGSQWSSGTHSVTVGGKDNSYYLDQGQINFKPGNDVFNGKMFDPLTPFKSNFDTISSTASNDKPQLLDENVYLFGSLDSAGGGRRSLLKDKLGRFAGELVDESRVISDRSVDPVTGRVSNVFYAPDGLVYKWKEGIGIFTQFGNNLDMNDPSRVGHPSLTKEPFAAQGVMNVLSLLITGIPYNFATYYKATLEYDGATNDANNKENAANSFSNSLKNDLSKSNALWGNFIPFKNLVLDEASYVLSASTQNSIIKKNAQVDIKIKQLAELNKEIIIAGGVNITSDSTIPGRENTRFVIAQQQIQKLQGEIDQYLLDIDAEEKKLNATDIKTNDSITDDKKDKSLSDAAIRRLMRRQLNFLTRRMSYNVRANQDKNLFIVDDTYDKDTDITVYEQSLETMKLYNNEFTTVKQKIEYLAQLLNMEVFCDSQGHIRARSPQYNRMPSSVFYKMMHLKQALGIQVFPEFLNDLFKNKLDTLKSRIEILEDQIRLDCAILGKDSDEDSINLLSIIGGMGPAFSFISEPGTIDTQYKNGGIITDIANLIKASNPDTKNNNAGTQNIQNFKKIEAEARSTKEPLTGTGKNSLIRHILKLQDQEARNGVVPPPNFLSASNTWVDALVNRIYLKSGQRINKRDYLLQDIGGSIGIKIPAGTTIDTFKIIEELSQKMREHQKAVKLFYSTIKNAREFRYLDDKNNSGNQLIAPGTYGKSSIPEIFEHMIEDETYDDYGVGSGSRYIIKRNQITNISISENPPPYCMVEVQGSLDLQLVNAPNEGFNALSNGGNGMTSAVAVDYDMWRTYGFKSQSPINVPFLRDPVTQVAPYATMLLSRNRKNILKGSVTIAGNEFMQPGEVVYIEDRGLLFYVASVRHSFTFGSSFQTSLELTYGHTAGEYIPTVTDMLGKLIYNNKDVADLAVERQESSGSDINIGVLQLSRSSESDGGINKSLGTDKDGKKSPNSFSAANAQVINDIIYTTAYRLRDNLNADKNTVAKIELRTYFSKSSGKPANKDLLEFVNKIRKVLSGEAEVELKNISTDTHNKDPKFLNIGDIEDADKAIVDLENTSDRRSPSQKAFAAARNFVEFNKSSSLKGAVAGVGEAAGKLVKDEAVSQDNSNKQIKVQQDAVRDALCENIVDCWIIFKSKESEKC